MSEAFVLKAQSCVPFAGLCPTIAFIKQNHIPRPRGEARVNTLS